jgi:hypothetical protein
MDQPAIPDGARRCTKPRRNEDFYGDWNCPIGNNSNHHVRLVDCLGAYASSERRRFIPDLRRGDITVSCPPTNTPSRIGRRLARGVALSGTPVWSGSVGCWRRTSWERRALEQGASEPELEGRASSRPTAMCGHDGAWLREEVPFMFTFLLDRGHSPPGLGWLWIARPAR